MQDVCYLNMAVPKFLIEQMSQVCIQVMKEFEYGTGNVKEERKLELGSWDSIFYI